MQGKATLGGHPIHPMLVTVPIGCFVAAIVSDIVSIWAGTFFWSAMATALIGFGIAGALLAALFGTIDYLSAPMSPEARSIAGWHMVLNLGMVVIYGVAFALRVGDHTSLPGYVLSVAGFIVLGISGVLGGSLAHGHLVGSSEADRGAPRVAADRAAMSPSERASLERQADRETTGTTYRGTL